MTTSAQRAVAGYTARVRRHTQRPWLGSPAPSITFREFRQVVRRFRPSDLLEALALLACTGDPDTPEIGPLGTYAPHWAIASIARESLLWGNEHRSNDVSAEDLRVLFNAFSNIYERDNRHGGGAHAILTRIAYEQFPYQESAYEEVARTHALLVEGTSALKLEVLDQGSWDCVLGAPLDLTVGTTFFLQVAANNNAGVFDPNWMDRDDMGGIYNTWSREDIAARAERMSTTVDEFRQSYREAPKPPRDFERYAYNPLSATPFIRQPDGTYLAPQPKLILRTITPGALYYRGIGELGDAFGRDLGRLTEHYVGTHLKLAEPTARVVPEITYGRTEHKSVDWLVELPSVLLMVEVKSARFGLLERAAVRGFEDKVESLLTKAIRQLERTSKAIDDGLPEFSALPAHLPRIGLIVTGEPFYLANGPWMRELLPSTQFPTLVASLRDLEHLMSLPLEEIERQLREIAADPERSTWSLGNALDMSQASENPVLDQAWNAYPWPGGIRPGPS